MNSIEKVKQILEDYDELIHCSEECEECKGRCCKRSACNCHPYDFNFDMENIKKAIASGKYAIDFGRDSSYCFVLTNKGTTLSLERILSTDDVALYVRPRNKNRPIVDILHYEKCAEGPCVLWSKANGCELSYEERPFYGKILVAAGNGDLCYPLLGRESVIDSWRSRNFQEELYKIAKEYFDPEWYMYKKFNFYL